jgi:hypothetical protein
MGWASRIWGVGSEGITPIVRNIGVRREDGNRLEVGQIGFGDAVDIYEASCEAQRLEESTEET